MVKALALQPSLRLQCIGFMIGSSLFAIGSAPGLSDLLGSSGSNLCFFIGAWFFTAAAFIQLELSRPMRTGEGAIRAAWLAASTQFLGTLLFNVSTGSALMATSAVAERDLVWTPDAGGSVAFLISGVFVLLVLARSGNLWRPISADWASGWVNMLGCVAFGVSAVGAIVVSAGSVENQELATWGTFIGAICFFVASAVVLPGAGGEEGPDRAPADLPDEPGSRQIG